jgi:hypothetical protein
MALLDAIALPILLLLPPPLLLLRVGPPLPPLPPLWSPSTKALLLPAPAEPPLLLWRLLCRLWRLKTTSAWFTPLVISHLLLRHAPASTINASTASSRAAACRVEPHRRAW